MVQEDVLELQRIVIDWLNAHKYLALTVIASESTTGLFEINIKYRKKEN